MADTSIHPSGCRCVTCLAGYSEPAAPASLGERPEILSAETVAAILANASRRWTTPDLNSIAEVDRKLCASHEALRAEVASLSSSLREARADSERIDALEAWRKGDQTICAPGNHGGHPQNWLIAREDDSRSDRHGRWASEREGPTLRAAIDAASAWCAENVPDASTDATEPEGRQLENTKSAATTRAEDATP